MPNKSLLRRRAGHVISDSERHFPPSSQSFSLGQLGTTSLRNCRNTFATTSALLSLQSGLPSMRSTISAAIDSMVMGLFWLRPNAVLGRWLEYRPPFKACGFQSSEFFEGCSESPRVSILHTFTFDVRVSHAHDFCRRTIIASMVAISNSHRTTCRGGRILF